MNNSSKNSTNNIDNSIADLNINDYELNTFPYRGALLYDKRD